MNRLYYNDLNLNESLLQTGLSALIRHLNAKCWSHHSTGICTRCQNLSKPWNMQLTCPLIGSELCSIDLSDLSWGL